MKLLPPPNRRKIWLAIILTGFFLLGLREIPLVAANLNPNRFWDLQVKRAERGVRARQLGLWASEYELWDYLARCRGVPDDNSPWYPPDRRLPEVYTLELLVGNAAEGLSTAEFLLMRLNRQWLEAVPDHP